LYNCFKKIEGFMDPGFCIISTNPDYDKWKSAAKGVGIAAAVTLAVAAVALTVFILAPPSLAVLGAVAIGGAALGTGLAMGAIALALIARQKKAAFYQ
jgi:hypothetical protein